MTLFNADGKEPVQTPTPEPTLGEGESYLDKYVGEGKKYKTVEDAMKALDHSQTYIPTLEQENAFQREEIAKRSTLEEFLDKIEARARTATSRQPDGEGDDDQVSKPPASISKEDIRKLVKEATLEERNNLTQEQNWQQTAAALEKEWGPTWQRQLVSKQQELGLSQEFMNSIAAKSPKALLNLVGISHGATKGAPNTDSPPRPSVSVNPNYSGNTVVKNKAYWDNMAKKDPILYRSAEMTAERHRSALALREKYFE